MPDSETVSAAATPSRYAKRARYFHSGNAFNMKLPPVPRHQFLAERDAAFDAGTGTGLIPLDIGDRLGCDFPATTPLVLARYVRIRAGESLSTRLKASGEIYYVFTGAGETRNGGDVLAWRAGDVFRLPGGGESAHRAGPADCVLWLVTNEPELAFERVEPPAPGNAPVEAVHYPAEEIACELGKIHEMPRDPEMAGLALVFSSAALERARNILPSLTLAMNSLPAGEAQRPHRHNAAALTLAVQARNCYSLIEGQRVDWQQNAVMVTPPGEVHSHHNDGDELMLSLVVQDGGLYYHCRTMGFSYVD